MLNFAPEIAEMGINRAIERPGIATPDAPEKLFAAEHPAWVTCQLCEQIELTSGQIKSSAIQ